MKLVIILLILFAIYVLLGLGSGYASSVLQIPAGTRWTSLAYGNGYYVAVGDNTKNGGPNIVYSRDGINWTPGQNLPKGSWNAIEFGNGRFVAGSGNFNGIYGNGNNFDISDWVYYFVATDPTGSWTPCNKIVAPSDSNGSTGYLCYQITYGNGLFRTTGTLNGKPYSSMLSPDGLNWTFDTNLNFPCTYSSLARGRDRFVIVSNYRTQNYPGAAFLIDGQTTWQLSDPNRTFDATSKVIYDSTRNLFLTTAGYTSSDGYTWTERIGASLSIAINEIGQISKVGQKNIIYTLNDRDLGVTQNFNPGGINWNSIFYVNGLFIAFSTGIADSGVTPYTSAYSYDGIVWNANDVYIPPRNQSCVYNWVNVGNCVDGFQNQQLHISQPSLGNGTPCPGNNNGGQSVPCNGGGVVPVVSPPPPPPVAEVPPPIEKSISCVTGIQGNLSTYMTVNPSRDYSVDGSLDSATFIGIKSMSPFGGVLYVVDSEIYIRSIYPSYVKTVAGKIGHSGVNKLTQDMYDFNGLEADQVPIEAISSFVVDQFGAIYFITMAGDIFVINNGILHYIQNIPINMSITFMACDSYNNIYVYVDQIIYNITNGSVIKVGMDISSMTITSCGNIMITNADTLYSVDIQGNVSAIAKSSKGRPLMCLTSDDSNNIYWYEDTRITMCDSTMKLTTLAKIGDETILDVKWTMRGTQPVIYATNGTTIYQIL
jgi:hypothetical protein